MNYGALPLRASQRNEWAARAATDFHPATRGGGARSFLMCYRLGTLFLCWTLACLIIGAGCRWGIAFGLFTASAATLGITFANIPAMRSYVLAGGLALIAALTTALDLAFAVIVSIGDTLPVAAIGLALAMPFISGGAPRRPRIALAAFLVWLALLPHIHWDVRKPFRKAFARIRSEMTEEQAEIEIRSALGGAPPRVSRGPSEWLIWLGAERSPWNGELISLRVRDGLVVSASYSAD